MSDAWMFPSIPAMGGGPWFSTGTSGLGNAQNSYNANLGYFGDQNRTMATAGAYDPFANTPGGFGGQTAAYAGAGAAYGRGTGGFGFLPGGAPAAPGRVGTIGNPGTSSPGYLDGGPPPGGSLGSASPSGSVSRGPDLPDLSPSMPAQPPVPYFGSPAGLPFGSGGFGRPPTVFDTGAPGISDSPPPGSFSPSPNYIGGSRGSIAQSLMPPPPDFNNAFRQFGMPGPQMQTQDAFDTMRRFNGVGTGVMPDTPGLPPSPPPTASEGGEGSFADRFSGAPEGGAGSSGSFADRFAGGNYFQPGKPSQYYTGDRYPGAQAPPAGYETLFGADNPGGALPVGGFRGLPQPPVMNAEPADDLGPADTLTARDRAIGQGSSGGFYPTPFNPGQFAPSSPFGSGAGVGGRPGGSGGLGSGVGTKMPITAPPFFGGEGSGFGAPGSTQSGGLYAGRRSPGVLGQMPGFIGTSQDAYGNPFIQGSAPPFAQGVGRMGGGVGYGGLDALGQGTVYRGR